MWIRPLRRLANALWALAKLTIIGAVVYLGSCAPARTILQTAPNDLPAGFKTPQLGTVDASVSRALLESELYGPVVEPTVVSRNKVTRHPVLGGKAELLQFRLTAGYGAGTRPLDVAVVLPAGEPDAPLLLSQNFCPNSSVLPFAETRRPERDACAGFGALRPIFEFVFGRHISEPPIGDIIEAGYAFAATYPSQFVPDSAQAGTAALDTLFPEDLDRPGALAVWAGLAPEVAQAVEELTAPRPVVAIGHSRFGKTALLSAAWFEEIDAAISHQSGTLGASRLTDEHGEPLGALVRSYPHWINRRAVAYAGSPESLPVRPRDLLGMLSDKSVLLGNARRDVWSDPFGAFVEARAAWPGTFGAARPADFREEDRHAFWQRPGTHGVTKEDWEAFLAWLDAQDF